MCQPLSAPPSSFYSTWDVTRPSGSYCNVHQFISLNQGFKPHTTCGQACEQFILVPLITTWLLKNRQMVYLFTISDRWLYSGALLVDINCTLVHVCVLVFDCIYSMLGTHVERNNLSWLPQSCFSLLTVHYLHLQNTIADTYCFPLAINRLYL